MTSIENELEILKQGLKELDLPLTLEILNKFRIYLEVLHEYKGQLHLISNNDYQRIAVRHFLPSLLVVKYLKNEKNACDIGAGAGFPSIPVKILRPDINFTLFESVKKKARFLSELIASLGLFGIEVMAMRAEDYKEKRFDLILIKAAGKIKDLVKTVDSLLNPDGKAIFYKKADVDGEIKQANEKIRKKNFFVKIEKTTTPVERMPISLVFLYRP
ncbi:MAG: 16S rRNA (guanine(527)-N(7))-methyltransferase RsmG [candidate division WOR-3 bacterium]|nr:16S rRNA (guanine(527)-N(7))-methyltransferase RsmG [candidate division WOR-3 bacterium]